MSTKPKPRPEITAAVLLWAWTQVLDGLVEADHSHAKDTARATKAAKSELLKLGLIDQLGTPTKEGRRLLALI